MPSSLPSSSLSSSPSLSPRTWDIFCTVIDNFGDIGVCWRLARQLASEYNFTVRLWVDDLPSFRRIWPQVDPGKSVQTVLGIEVRHWSKDFPQVTPGDVVIEAFACHLPERFVAAMAARCPAPVWINLDYLSAEDWVSGCHTLPSPHPQLALAKYFFFPGFSSDTGGLLREAELIAKRESFAASSEQQADFWRFIGQTPPDKNALRISLFSYENPAIKDLLTFFAQGHTPVCCLVPATRNQADIEAFAERLLSPGEVFRTGSLELRILPFVSQTDYDRLLWSCDINFVRGEDSLVRALWAAKPIIWQLYPQEEETHLVKLDAFLDRFLAQATPQTDDLIRKLHHGWNGSGNESVTSEVWAQYQKNLPEIRKHCSNWTKNLLNQPDLSRNLVNFVRSKL